MIINEKNVEFIIEIEDTPPSLRLSVYFNLFWKRILKSLEEQNQPYITEMFKCYLANSIGGFLDHFKKISPKLKNILTVIGPLYGTSITGEEMRTIFDREVDDGPKLRIMNMDAWHNSIEKYLRLNPLISP